MKSLRGRKFDEMDGKLSPPKNQILVYEKPEIAEKLNQDLDELMKTGLNDFSTKRKLK